MSEDINIRSRGYLPHWERTGSVYFVTFRTADALPAKVVSYLESLREDILRTAEQNDRQLNISEEHRLARLQVVDKYLDAGEGACHLAKPNIAAVVAEALRHFDGERYQLIAWCIMPNHVHVVLKLERHTALSSVLHSWKSFTAKKINETLNRGGEFWQREYYDHVVRNEADLERVVRYVVENPVKAKLHGWRWIWIRSAPTT
ncbi:MAG TPA: transposase [Terriglobales bacterium]|jgi:REP element-mobilizing transposase RayT